MHINLSNKEKSDVCYVIHKRSDGQQDIVINLPIELDEEASIKSRFNSFQDLELIIGATKCLRRLGVEIIHLEIPYLLGARGDRQFEEGGNSYLVDVIAPIINAQNYKSVTVMDVHSDVAAACINNLKVTGNSAVMRRALTAMTIMEGAPLHIFDKLVLLSPDAGALKKVYKIAEKFSFKGDVIVASKHRDTTTNAIVSTTVPYKTEYDNKFITIIDDICDGGRTFIEIAKAIKSDSKHQEGKLILVITHGIFSYGLKPLSEWFDLIVTTNSVRDFTLEEIKDFSGLFKVVNVI